MKTKNLLLTIVAISMAMTSCDKNETTVQTYDGSVRFISGVTATPSSRVAIDDQGKSVWNENDPIGIFMVKHGATTVVNAAANMKYTAAQAGASTSFTPSGSDIYYPLDESAKVDFIAYHPYGDAIGDDFAYAINLSDQTSQTNIDLMTAKADNSGKGYSKENGRNNSAVNFTFTHRLVKLVMNVTKDASVPGTITGVSIKGMNTAATFDLKGVAGFTSVGSPIAITPSKTSENKYEAILLPVAALTDDHLVTFTTDEGETYNWVMKKQISSLEVEKIYTYDVNVTKYEIIASGAINRWTEGSKGSGTAE